MKIIEPRYYEEKQFLMMANKIRKRLKRVLKIPIIGKTERQKDILFDVYKMYPLMDLVEYLYKDNFKTYKDYLHSLAKWFELEHLVFEYPHELEYKEGKMEETIKLILIHHKNLEKKNKVSVKV